MRGWMHAPQRQEEGAPFDPRLPEPPSPSPSPRATWRDCDLHYKCPVASGSAQQNLGLSRGLEEAWVQGGEPTEKGGARGQRQPPSVLWIKERTGDFQRATPRADWDGVVAQSRDEGTMTKQLFLGGLSSGLDGISLLLEGRERALAA